MEAAREDGEPRGAVWALRIGLAVFVLAWLFSPRLRVVPFWIPFLIALGLELQFFLGAARKPAGGARADRGPQPIDLQRYGYAGKDDLLLVRRGGEELWVPWSGESGEELDELIEREREAQRERLAARLAARPGRRGLPIRRLLVGLGVIASLAAVLWFVDRRAGWDGLASHERAAAAERFSAEASRVVGRPVVIRCDDAGRHVGVVQHADGVAQVGGRLAYLTPERCFDLYLLAFDDDVRFSQTARSLAVLAHEAWHLRGVRDEATTECYALQSGVEIGRRLGLSERTARRMMRQQLVENGLRGVGTAEYRVGPECRDGGELDLNPRSADFP